MTGKKQNPLSHSLRGFLMVCQRRFELPTHGLEVRCSIQLSYGRIDKMERETGFEPATFSLEG